MTPCRDRPSFRLPTPLKTSVPKILCRVLVPLGLTGGTVALPLAPAAIAAPSLRTPMLTQWVTPDPPPSRSPQPVPPAATIPSEPDPAQSEAQPRAQATLPDFGSPRLNEQLRHYWRYVQTLGKPDVLIVGSSRALQGLDPHVLSHHLARQGHGKLRVYNFGINGATAQVVSWVLLDLLGRDRLPSLILWPNGSRAFNNARLDRTFRRIANSPGYQQLQQGWRPPWTSLKVPSPALSPLAIFPPVDLPLGDSPSRDRPASFLQSTLTFNGFLRDQRRFHPPSYYQDFPKVAGQFDGSYIPFLLWEGPQKRAVQTLAQTLAQRPDTPSLVLINLPLSRDFLDTTRRSYEQQFQRFMETVHAQSRSQFQSPWLLRDYLDLWPTQNHYFADPSHINLWGAAALARHLATDTNIPWPTPQTP